MLRCINISVSTVNHVEQVTYKSQPVSELRQTHTQTHTHVLAYRRAYTQQGGITPVQYGFVGGGALVNMTEVDLGGKKHLTHSAVVGSNTNTLILVWKK